MYVKSELLILSVKQDMGQSTQKNIWKIGSTYQNKIVDN